MMVGNLLVGFAQAEERGFSERGSDELETDGEALQLPLLTSGSLRVPPRRWRGSSLIIGRGREAAGEGDAGKAGEVDRYREDVGEVHGERVIGFCADLKGDGRRGGACDDVHVLEGIFEIFFEEQAHVVGFFIIRVVIAGGERVRAYHHAAFGFGAEAMCALLLIPFN